MHITRDSASGSHLQVGDNSLPNGLGHQIRVADRWLVDGNELGRRLGVGRTTVWRLTKLGRIPHYTVGRRWLYCETEVLEALRVPAGGKSNQLSIVGNDRDRG